MNLASYAEQLPRGGKKLFALKLGVTASYLSRLISGDRSITAERCLQIEEATGGAVTRFDLRPDLPWSQPKKAKGTGSAKLGATMDQIMRPKPSVLQSANHPVRTSSAAQASP